MENKENLEQKSDKPPPLPARPKSIKIEENEENDDELSQQMTASYSEISDNEGAIDQPNEKSKRPVTLCDTCSLGPLTLEGTVHIEGNMTHFVAEDLEYKIKISSPQSKKGDTLPSLSQRSSTSSMRHIKSHMGNLDVSLLNDLENEAQHLATSVDNLTENLCGILHSISSITADNVDVYKNAVSKMSDDMDANIKSMYTMMAKAEEVTQTMKCVEAHAHRVKEIKKLVDLFESFL